MSSARLPFASLLLVGAFALGCGPQKYIVTGTDLVAGADGTVLADVKKDLGSTQIDVRVDHLAPPQRLKPLATAFVAWQRRDSATTWSRVGALRYDEGSRRGELKDTTIPETRFDLLITVETEVSPAAPASEVVFAQRVGESG
jgi:hypothetical protein